MRGAAGEEGRERGGESGREAASYAVVPAVSSLEDGLRWREVDGASRVVVVLLILRGVGGVMVVIVRERGEGGGEGGWVLKWVFR